MITNTIALGVNLFLMVICILQITANFTVLYIWISSRSLRKNNNIILLVSLAFIDFAYAVLQFPYLFILIKDWVPDGHVFDYNAAQIVWIGGPSAALMKSGCTVTSAIAADRVIALYFPMFYYKQSKRFWSISAFALSMFLASVDFAVMCILVKVEPHPGCSAFGCFTNDAFRTWWGQSNMAMNLLSCILTLIIVKELFSKSSIVGARRVEIENHNRRKIDHSANRVAVYILIVSALIGVVPGCINGFGELLKLTILNEISFFVGTCATLSGLSHAFIFGMAHRDIRVAIGRRLIACFMGNEPKAVQTVSFIHRSSVSRSVPSQSRRLSSTD